MNGPVTSQSNYQLWFLSQGVVGFINAGGAAFLIAPLITSQGGTPADAGMVVGLLPFVALLSPIFGIVADRFNWHREMVLLGLALLALASAALLFAEQDIGYVAGALLFGAGGGMIIVANLAMLAASGLPSDVVAKRMGLLQMSLPLGQFTALGITALLLAMGVELQTVFAMHVAVALGGLVLMWNATKAPSQRVRELSDSRAEQAAQTEESPSRMPKLGTVILSAFGLFLLINFLSQFAEQLIESQYPNYLNGVFGIDPEVAAIAMAIAVLISAPLYPVSGRWAASRGVRGPFTTSIFVRTATALGLGVLAATAGSDARSAAVQLGAIVLYGLMITVYPFFEVNTSLIAARLSPIGVGGGQGLQGAATQGAGIIGGFAAGWLASELGFESLAWFSTGIAVAALVLVFFLKLPEPEPAEAEPLEQVTS